MAHKRKLAPLPGILPAVDMVELGRCSELIGKLYDCEGITAFKIGSLPVWEHGLGKVSTLPGPKVYDAQKASDTPHIVERQVELIAKHGFVGIIENPLGAGRRSLQTFVEKCYEDGIIPIIVVEMTQEDALSYSSLEKAEKLAVDFAEMGGEYIVVPARKPERIERYRELGERYGDGFYVISPGIGPQGSGDAVKDSYEAVFHGADYVIVGRVVYEASDPKAVARGVYEAVFEAYQERKNLEG